MARTKENLELTSSEKACLVAYRQHLQKHRAPPSGRALAALLGVYPTAARHTLRRLVDKGYLEDGANLTPCLVPTEKGKKVKA